MRSEPLDLIVFGYKLSNRIRGGINDDAAFYIFYIQLYSPWHERSEI